MIICSCNVLTDGQIRECLRPGPGCPLTPAQVYRCLGCNPRCGRCATTIRSIMDSALPTLHAQCQEQCCKACPRPVDAPRADIGDSPAAQPAW